MACFKVIPHLTTQLEVLISSIRLPRNETWQCWLSTSKIPALFRLLHTLYLVMMLGLLRSCLGLFHSLWLTRQFTPTGLVTIFLFNYLIGTTFCNLSKNFSISNARTYILFPQLRWFSSMFLLLLDALS